MVKIPRNIKKCCEDKFTYDSTETAICILRLYFITFVKILIKFFVNQNDIKALTTKFYKKQKKS